MQKKTATSFRLSEQALAILKTIAEKKGVSRHAILEMAIREYAATQKALTTKGHRS